MKAILLAASILGAASMAQGAIIIYSAVLDGPSENPTNSSTGTGLTYVTINDVANTMRVQISFSGLTGTTTASHIHAPTTVPGGTAGVATTTPTFTGFPIGVTSGSMDQTYDMTQLSSFNPAFVTAHGGTAATAFTDLKASIAAGTSYLNIHSSTFGGGEIRGFLVPAPEPSTGLLGLAGFGLALGRRRR